MLSQPAPARPPPDGRDEDRERDQLENELTDAQGTDLGGLLTFSASSPRPTVTSKDRGRHFRQVYLPAVSSRSDLAEDQGEESSGHSTSDEDDPVAKPFCGHFEVEVKNSLDYTGRGFFNPDGKSCGITASLTLLQYVRPFMELIASRKGKLCTKLCEIYQLRGLKDKSILKSLDYLRSFLGVPVDEDIDANEFMHKLVGGILKDEAVLPQTFCGKRKVKLALNSSSSCEVLLQKFFDTDNADNRDFGYCAVTSLGFPATDNAGNIVVSLRDLLSEKLRESETVPYSDWAREWKDQYPDNEGLQCEKVTVYECAPDVVILALQRGTATLTPKKDNQPIQIPLHIPEDDFTHPEDECIHSLDCTGGSLFLFGMIVHSEVRNHQYSMVKIQDSTWIVHDDLYTYEVNLTAELLKNLGGKERSDSAVTFVYIKSSDLAVEKPPLPDKAKQKDILQRLESNIHHKSDDDGIVPNDEKEVDYQRIYHRMEASTHSFVGLEPLKQQFLRFAKTAILNQKRKQLGFQVEDMSTQCLHFIFQGNPGTGKTTFARKVADLLYSVRKIKKRKVVEVQRGDLVGQFLGSTEDKTANKINEAKGGVLFVDEAYRLTPRSSNVDYGRVAINQLMAAMEKGDPVMIFAGYPNEMKEFLKSNPGLDSRIKYKFTFPDYSVQELATILDNGIRDSGYRYSGQTSLAEIIESETTAAIRSQQNGRLAKNIVSEAIINLSSRLSFADDGVKLVTLQAEDFIQACRVFCHESDPSAEDTTEPELKENDDE
ncbi:uncharacterized protein LOC114951485 [Acropora millepora]|uniref:uncharacterized protein LOC114951485 n=1 Tax=Acropora millepora TaxID=45264 RepID=UPI001CF3759D|nr:uncharacterized protein LOC114951485 [Acropora millepora]